MEKIERLRKKVRENDRRLVRLLKKRMQLTGQIGKRKKDLGLPVKDPPTERKVLDNALRTGRALGLSTDFIASIMRNVLAESKRAQHYPYSSSKEGVNIASTLYLPTPSELKHALPLTQKGTRTVSLARRSIRRILEGKDPRLIVIMGPCSIHDVGQAQEFAQRMYELKEKVEDRFFLVMRTYFEKSRTSRGWTGFLSDPHLDGSGNINDGITMARTLLLDLAELGIPAATEFINPLTPGYLGDLVSYTAIGARSSGSQMHRDLASGLSMPVGFKNGTDGNITIAIEAALSAGSGHSLLGVDESGEIRAFRTHGNKYCHLILRGGVRPNYDPRSVKRVLTAMRSARVRSHILVDCSHGNSGKLAQNQVKVFNSVFNQRLQGNKGIVGMMLESFLNGGKQRLPDKLTGFDPKRLSYGVSVTDECLGWEATQKLILGSYEGSKGYLTDDTL
jgi:3-deoxy-7-phosphoheptulonate synthase